MPIAKRMLLLVALLLAAALLLTGYSLYKEQQRVIPLHATLL